MSGVPDLYWLEAFCWIEFKTPTGKLSKTQKQFLDRASKVGYQTIVAYGLEDAKKKVITLKEALNK